MPKLYVESNVRIYARNGVLDDVKFEGVTYGAVWVKYRSYTQPRIVRNHKNYVRKVADWRIVITSLHAQLITSDSDQSTQHCVTMLVPLLGRGVNVCYRSKALRDCPSTTQTKLEREHAGMIITTT